jgi:hypothetical protein
MRVMMMVVSAAIIPSVSSVAIVIVGETGAMWDTGL